MNRKLLGTAIVLAAVAAACGGEGRASSSQRGPFSWLGGIGQRYDSVRGTPPLTVNFSVFFNSEPGRSNLVPGLGSSGIDTVKVSGSALVLNQSGGPGTLRFQVYLASDALGTYGASG